MSSFHFNEQKFDAILHAIIFQKDRFGGLLLFV